MAYSGFFVPVNKEKYQGNWQNIVFRSLWERFVFNWCDMNPNVKYWSSEEFYIPYVYAGDGKAHRYFIDLKIEFTNGKIILVEIKPEAQTIKPDLSKRKSRNRLLTEAATYVKNVSKWKAAQIYCEERGWQFQIWTEKTLKQLGINVGGGVR